ncbi:MAG: hypothetical protein AB1553_09080 [Nitrospirota bacterium]
MTERNIQEVFQAHSGELMALPGVIGTAVGHDKDKPCIKVFTRKSTAALEKKMPSELEGYPVVLEVIAEIKTR